MSGWTDDELEVVEQLTNHLYIQAGRLSYATRCVLAAERGPLDELKAAAKKRREAKRIYKWGFLVSLSRLFGHQPDVALPWK